MPSDTPKRQRFFVNCEVQSAILFRVGIYGCATTLYFVITLICTQCLSDPERGFVESLMKCLEDVIYWLPGFLFLVPVAAHDLLKMTNHFAGPVQRLQNEMQSLAAGTSERPIAFREDDYWNELSLIYNQIRGELLTLRKQVADQVETVEESMDEVAIDSIENLTDAFTELDAIDRLQASAGLQSVATST